MRIGRRSLLEALGGVAVVGTAGCISSIGSGSEAGSERSDETAATAGDARTVTMGDTGALSFAADVAEQPSSEAPARIAARVETTGSEPVRVGLGPTLLFSDDSGDLAWSSELVLNPDDPGVKMPGETRSIDGCWRHLADAKQPIQSILKWHTIEPNGSLRETFDVYTRGDAGPCLPEGTYRYQDEILVGNESRSVTTTLVVEVSSDRTLSATATVDQSVPERTSGSTRTAAPSTPAMTPSTPVGTSDAGADVGINNFGDEPRTVHLVVEQDETTPVRPKTDRSGRGIETVGPAARQAGIYLITATLDGGASATYEWALDDPAAAAARTVYADIEGSDVEFTDFYV